MMITWVEKVNQIRSMSDEWNGIYFSNIGNGVVELRRKFAQDGHFSQILIRVRPNDVVEISMNGKAVMTAKDMCDMSKAVIEAQTKLALAGK